MYHIALCDDDLNYIKYLEMLFIRRAGIDPNEVLFYEYESGEALIKILDKGIPFQLLILDMQMKVLDGDDTASAFRKRYPTTLLVFCSGERLPTVSSFEVEAYRYLLKDYDSDKMTFELNAIIKEMQRRESLPHIPIIYRGETLLIHPSEILYVSIRKYGSNIYLYDSLSQETNHHISNQSLANLYDMLPKTHFAYAHKSYFVNLQYVTGFADHQIELRDKTILAVSRAREKEFKKALSDYLSAKY